jgi:hypothetical protein
MIIAASTSAGTWDTNISSTGAPRMIVKYMGPA